MYTTDRQQTRQHFFQTWQKFQAQQFLTALEKQILQVILDHPEYQYIFNNPDKYLDEDYLPEVNETNPYAHLAFHLAIRDQIETDRPAGIRQIFQQYCQKFRDNLVAEHEMMECLAGSIWQALQPSGQFDSENYLENLKMKV